MMKFLRYKSQWRKVGKNDRAGDKKYLTDKNYCITNAGGRLSEFDPVSLKFI